MEVYNSPHVEEREQITFSTRRRRMNEIFDWIRLVAVELSVFQSQMTADGYLTLATCTGTIVQLLTSLCSWNSIRQWCHSPGLLDRVATATTCTPTNYNRRATSSKGKDQKDATPKMLWSQFFSGEVTAMILPCFSLLKTNGNLLYIRNQFVPHSKLFPPRLQKPISLWCTNQKPLSVLRSTQNPQRKTSAI